MVIDVPNVMRSCSNILILMANRVQVFLWITKLDQFCFRMYLLISSLENIIQSHSVLCNICYKQRVAKTLSNRSIDKSNMNYIANYLRYERFNALDRLLRKAMQLGTFINRSC